MATTVFIAEGIGALALEHDAADVAIWKAITLADDLAAGWRAADDDVVITLERAGEHGSPVELAGG